MTSLVYIYDRNAKVTIVGNAPRRRRDQFWLDQRDIRRGGIRNSDEGLDFAASCRHGVFRVADQQPALLGKTGRYLVDERNGNFVLAASQELRRPSDCLPARPPKPTRNTDLRIMPVASTPRRESELSRKRAELFPQRGEFRLLVSHQKKTTSRRSYASKAARKTREGSCRVCRDMPVARCQIPPSAANVVNIVRLKALTKQQSPAGAHEIEQISECLQRLGRVLHNLKAGNDVELALRPMWMREGVVALDMRKAASTHFLSKQTRAGSIIENPGVTEICEEGGDFVGCSDRSQRGIVRVGLDVIGVVNPARKIVVVPPVTEVSEQELADFTSVVGDINSGEAVNVRVRHTADSIEIDASKNERAPPANFARALGCAPERGRGFKLIELALLHRPNDAPLRSPWQSWAPFAWRGREVFLHESVQSIDIGEGVFDDLVLIVRNDVIDRNVSLAGLCMIDDFEDEPNWQNYSFHNRIPFPFHPSGVAHNATTSGVAP